MLVLVLFVLASCTPGAAVDPTPAPPADPLLDVAQREGTVVVIVQLAVPRGSASSWDMTAVDRAQRRIMAALGPEKTVVERFRKRLPQIVLRVTPEGLAVLRQSPLVVNISLNETDEPTE